MWRLKKFHPSTFQMLVKGIEMVGGQFNVDARSLPREPATMSQHERAHLLAVNPQRFDGRRSSAHQIPHGFVSLVRDPNRRQFTGTKQPGKPDCVAPIVLDGVSWPSRNQRRSNDHAIKTKRCY